MQGGVILRTCSQQLVAILFIELELFAGYDHVLLFTAYYGVKFTETSAKTKGINAYIGL